MLSNLSFSSHIKLVSAEQVGALLKQSRPAKIVGMDNIEICSDENTSISGGTGGLATCNGGGIVNYISNISHKIKDIIIFHVLDTIPDGDGDKLKNKISYIKEYSSQSSLRGFICGGHFTESCLHNFSNLFDVLKSQKVKTSIIWGATGKPQSKKVYGVNVFFRKEDDTWLLGVNTPYFTVKNINDIKENFGIVRILPEDELYIGDGKEEIHIEKKNMPAEWLQEYTQNHLNNDIKSAKDS